MAYLNEIKAKGIFKIRITLAKAFVAKDDYEGDPELQAAYDGLVITLREPRGEEVLSIDAGTGTNDATWLKLFPECLIDWNVLRAENEKASKEEVLDLLRTSSTLYTYVLNEWGASLPLARKSGRVSNAPLKP
jgi:hypothetical protein